MADVRLTATNPEDSSVVPVACDAGGRLLLEEMPPAFDGTVDGDLTVSGKGTFAGGKSIIGNDGSAQFAQGAVDIYANGTVEFAQDVNFDGSAEFADVIKQGTYDSSSNTSTGAYIGNGSIISQQSTSVGEGAPAFQVRRGSAEPTVNIRSNGSADFAGAVQSGGNPDDGGAIGFKVINGKITSTRSSLADTYMVYTEDNPVPTITFKANGSAAFASNKAGFTKEGYLWCTTRRGDTVILDATSNGLASWVEYTPTSRIDDLRDKLDANRGDTGEMPADTQ